MRDPGPTAAAPTATAPTPTIIGVDIGGTKTAIVEGTATGEILTRSVAPTDADRPFADTWPSLATRIRAAIDSARNAGRDPRAISVAAPGPLRIAPGILRDPPNMPGWHNAHLKDALENLENPGPALPVYVEHDANAGALAEWRFGVGRDRAVRNLVYLTFGTGMGAGILANGRILHGATDTAGEVGHLRVAEEGPTAFGKVGAWEAFASGVGLVRLAARMFPKQWSVDTPIHDVVTAILEGDPDMSVVAAEAGRMLGRGLAILIDILNPEIIVVGSLGAVLGDRVLGPARAEVAREALSAAVDACRIVTPALGVPRAGDVASLMAAIEAGALNPAHPR
jgi:glucokinase